MKDETAVIRYAVIRYIGGPEGWPDGHAPAFWLEDTAAKAVAAGWWMSAGGWWHGPGGEMEPDTLSLIDNARHVGFVRRGGTLGWRP